MIQYVNETERILLNEIKEENNDTKKHDNHDHQKRSEDDDR